MKVARWALVLASIGLVAGLRAAGSPPDILPLFNVPQGITHMVVSDTPLFLSRQGNILKAFLARSTGPDRGRIVYCPAEDVFVSPDDKSLWTADGAWVAGIAARDLDQVRTRVNSIDLTVVVDTGKVIRAAGRSNGEVSGAVGDRYARFRAGDGFVRFCQDPQPPVPDAVPTPSP